MTRATLSLVIPIYNEEETIPLFYEAFQEYSVLKAFDFEIIFIDDGSQDRSTECVKALQAQDKRITLLELTRNFGKEAALSAGINHATGDAVIPMDVDLQDPLELIPDMIKAWHNGADVVLARRINRHSDPFLKRFFSNLFYGLYNKFANVPIPNNVGDFRLMDRRVVDAIKQLPERKIFMKGLLNWVGFQKDFVDYVRPKRSAGKSKFNFLKLCRLACDGIFSFSTTPLRIWVYIGVIISLLSFAYAVYMAIDKIIFGNPVPGYPSIMCSVLFLGGVQLIGIGVLGEYIGRIFHEVKGRPRYIVKHDETSAKDK